MKNKPIYIGLHIPKTAGATLLNLLESKLPNGTLHQTTNLVKNAKQGIPFIEEMEDTQNIFAVFGHYVNAGVIHYFPQRKVYLYTFLREPIARLVSHFHYQERLYKMQGRKPLSFREFSTINRNQICRYIVKRFNIFLNKNDKKKLALHEQAIKILQAFDLVGCSENFDKYLWLLLEDMKIDYSDTQTVGKRNVASYNGNKSLDIQQIHLLEKENEEDCKLYKYYMEKLLLSQNKKSRKKLIKNPIGLDERFKSKCISKVMKQSFNKEERLRTAYRRAANQYRNDGVLEEVIKKQKTILLKEALKIDCLRKEKSGKEETSDIYEKIKSLVMDIYTNNNL